MGARLAGRRGRVCLIGPWGRQNAAANLNNVEMVPGGTATPFAPRMKQLRSGRVTGITWSVSTGAAAGNGTMTPSLNGADPGVAYDSSAPGQVADLYVTAQFSQPLAFAVGDSLGVLITTDAAWAATSDVHAWLEVEWDD